MPALSRRELLLFMGAGSAAALTGCSADTPPRPVSVVPPGWMRGEERWIGTACGQCPAACGVRVRVREGRALKLEGDPAHPISQGGLGPKGQSGLQVLYHPDRIRSPLERDGERGAGRWKPISWQAAIDGIAARLRSLREAGEAQGLVVIDGEERGILRELWERFLAAYGSPNHVEHAHALDGGRRLAMAHMHGRAELPAFAWERTRYVLGIGAGLFESYCQTIHLMRVSSDKRRGVHGPRVKFVQASSRFSVTEAKADEWVPLAPGTHGALALGIAHVLVRDGLYDEDFVREHTFGFEDWTDAQGGAHRGYRDLVLSDYAPERVAELSEVPVETIERVARELGSNPPAIVLFGEEASTASNGAGTAMAIHALNALLGNLERPGGALVQRRVPLAPWPDLAPDETARAGFARPRIDGAGSPACALGTSCPDSVPAAILERTPYAVGALVFSRANPLLASPNAALWERALARVPLVVSTSSLPDETTLWADYVLPEPSYLERWEVVEPSPSTGRPLLAQRRPAVLPLHDTLHAGDVILRLARAIGSPLAEALPWTDFRAASLERLSGLAAASPVPDPEQLERDGWWIDEDQGFEQWDLAFATPSGRFEFYSQAIAARLDGLFPEPAAREAYLRSRGVAARGDELCLPHWEAPVLAGDPREYPHLLVPYHGIEHASGGSRHVPLLRELPTVGRVAWRERVELHPAHARELGVRDGDEVTARTPAGLRTMAVRVVAGTRPGTVGLPLGGGAWPPRADDPRRGGVAGLLVPLVDPLVGTPAVLGTRVLIEKVEVA